MKKWLFIFFLFPLLAHSQQTIITGLNRFIVGGSGGGGGTGVAIDFSYEVRTYSPVMNISYNPLRPNIEVTMIADLSLFMNTVPVGSGGNVRFIITSGVPHVNGTLTTAFPSAPVTVVKTYTNIGGTLTWN